MRTMSSLGIGLGIVFSFLFLALIAEIYYLLLWKKRGTTTKDDDDCRANSGIEFINYFCFKKPPTSSSTAVNPLETPRIADETDGSPIKPIAGEEGIEAELIRLHNLSGFPRLLFTIKEETKEDLESDDGRSRDDRSRKGSTGRSLSDILFHGDTPFMTPRCSPPVTPMNNYNYNPLFDSKTPANWASASPPPQFKFLRDAEEKLYRKTLMEEAMKDHRRASVNFESMDSKEEDGSFIKIKIGQQQHSSSPQVIPLPSLPSPTSSSLSTITRNSKE